MIGMTNEQEKCPIEKCPINVLSFMIPAGRMRGDVNGDGVISMKDVKLISEYCARRGKVDWKDDAIMMGCADTDQDNIISANDDNKLWGYFGGNIKLGEFADDVLGVWSINPDYTTAEAQYYVDISVEGIDENTSAVLCLPNTIEEGLITGVTFSAETGLRIYAKRLPVQGGVCYLFVLEDGEKGFTVIGGSGLQSSVDKNIFYAKINETTYDEILEAHLSGKICIASDMHSLYVLSRSISDGAHYFVNVYMGNKNGVVTGYAVKEVVLDDGTSYTEWLSTSIPMCARVVLSQNGSVVSLTAMKHSVIYSCGTVTRANVTLSIPDIKNEYFDDDIYGYWNYELRYELMFTAGTGFTAAFAPSSASHCIRWEGGEPTWTEGNIYDVEFRVLQGQMIQDESSADNGKTIILGKVTEISPSGAVL